MGRILPKSVLESISAVIRPVLWQSSSAGKATLPTHVRPLNIFTLMAARRASGLAAHRQPAALCRGTRCHRAAFCGGSQIDQLFPLPLANAAVVIRPGGGGVAMAESRCTAARSTHHQRLPSGLGAARNQGSSCRARPREAVIYNVHCLFM